MDKEFEEALLADKLEKLSNLEQEMYDCIDDISTYADAAKDNLKLYQRWIMERIQKFHNKKLTITDGYDGVYKYI